jgi:hypothetical protein
MIGRAGNPAKLACPHSSWPFCVTSFLLDMGQEPSRIRVFKGEMRRERMIFLVSWFTFGEGSF